MLNDNYNRYKKWSNQDWNNAIRMYNTGIDWKQNEKAGNTYYEKIYKTMQDKPWGN